MVKVLRKMAAPQEDCLRPLRMRPLPAWAHTASHFFNVLTVQTLRG